MRSQRPISRPCDFVDFPLVFQRNAILEVHTMILLMRMGWQREWDEMRSRLAILLIMQGAWVTFRKTFARLDQLAFQPTIVPPAMGNLMEIPQVFVT